MLSLMKYSPPTPRCRCAVLHCLYGEFMKQIQSNKEYLKRLVEILEVPELRQAIGTRAEQAQTSAQPAKGKAGKPFDPKAVCASALAQLRELFNSGEKGFKKGVNIPFLQLCRKHNFDENEWVIFALIAAREISGHSLADPYRGNDSVLKAISALLAMPRMEILPYFLSSNRLKKSGLFSQDNYCRDEAVKPPSSLKESVVELLLKNGNPKKRKIQSVKPPRPRRIAELLNLNVIGQETAKKQLATVAFQHLERFAKPANPGLAVPRLNTLLLGPTGCGKTYITKRLAEILGVPVAFCDATQYTETGYVGASVEEMLIHLRRAAGDNPKTAEYGIIFIDEIDKIAAQNVGQSHNSERDVSGLSVQQDLLKMLEGDSLNYEKSRPTGITTYNFNVKNVLFIAAGAFQGLGDIVSERLKTKNQIGFKNQATSAREEFERSNLLRQVRPQDIIKYGFMPELVGRFPNIVTLDKLTREDFLGILGNQRTSLIEHYKAFFARNGIELEIPPAFVAEMADKATLRDLGARGLNSAVENFFSELMYELLDRKADSGAQKVNIMNCLRSDRLKELLA